MPFQNNVVAGKKLVRDAIQSPNYVAGTSGWTINKDGSAEFNNIAIRGDLTVGVSPADVIHIGSVGGTPKIEFFPAGASSPATITAFGDSTSSGMRLDAVGPSGTMSEFVTDDLWSVVHDTVPLSLSANANNGNVEIVADGLTISSGLSGALFVPLLVDGKVLASGSSTTTSASTTDVAVTSANLVNTPVIAGRAYRISFQVGLHSTVAADRAQFKIWNGAVGGTQMANGVVNKKCNANASQFETVQLEFIHRAVSTEVISNLNLSVNRLSGTGTVNVIIDQNYIATCLEIGNANNVGGL